jgi:hypothetical protein
MPDILEQAPQGHGQNGDDVMHDELGGVNPADLVRRCAGKRCDKSFKA